MLAVIFPLCFLPFYVCLYILVVCVCVCLCQPLLHKMTESPKMYIFSDFIILSNVMQKNALFTYSMLHRNLIICAPGLSSCHKTDNIKYYCNIIPNTAVSFLLIPLTSVNLTNDYWMDLLLFANIASWDSKWI